MSKTTSSPTDFKKIHFIGICGTAMGSVAAMLKEEGFLVTGSDANIYPPMSTILETAGIPVMEGYKPENLEQHAPDLVVVGNAISRGNPELEQTLDDRYYYLSLPEVLKLFFLRKTHNLIVTGTHGKTTTTSILSWIFEASGKQPSYLIGGVPLNFDNGCARQPGDHWILEGDEYDTAFFDKRSKFLHYLPESVIINNIEFDHADIYNSLDEIKRSFKHLVNIVPRSGMLVLNADDPNVTDVAQNAQAQLVEVGFSENAALRITDISQSPEGTAFRLLDHSFLIPMFGRHNVHNAAMAIALSHFYNIPLDAIDQALRSFKGVKRRLEVRAEKQGITIIDDFAHHPTAIRETLKALRLKYPGRRLWALFEPRSNTTRTAQFQNELPEALKLADAVVIGKVAHGNHPNETPLDAHRVAETLEQAGLIAWHESDVNRLLSRLISLTQPQDVIVSLSNGSFDGLLPKLINAFE